MFARADLESENPDRPYTYVILECLDDKFRTINITLKFYRDPETSDCKVEFEQLATAAKYKIDTIAPILASSLDDIGLVKRICRVYQTQEKKYRIVRTKCRHNKARYKYKGH